MLKVNFKSKLHKMSDYMMRNKIAHTLAIFKSTQFSDEANNLSDTLTVRAVIFPRKPREGTVYQDLSSCYCFF